MIEKLKARWGVDGMGLVLILCTFAIGGSLSGYLGRSLIMLMKLEGGWYYLPAYILVVSLLWPVCVIVVSLVFGQFGFFSNYLRKMGARMGLGKRSSAERSNAA